MKGLVRLRLARMGRSHQPVYNLVVTTKRTKRDGKPIEVIGTYNPVPAPLTPEQKTLGYVPTKDVKLDFQRAKYWLGVGAQPSDSVAKLLKKAGILYEEWPAPKNTAKVVTKKEVPLEGKKFA
ncbi:DEKNAAC103252 [Brettanomyces naardenensis]|uniref:DEKNAAC103252 n=1 Tax=Brettanomyces naardenensis TaxID=13370 RepID=A0A448YMZ6_BRENA|nr:DEKNAAC103252 [Brettanomyces naardenensis]